MVDDAHGLGVTGTQRPRQRSKRAGLDAADVPLLVGTLGKAFGCFGAFVAGDRDVVELVMQRARSYIYTTALPPACRRGCATALRICRDEAWRRERLAALIARFRAGARAAGLATGGVDDADPAAAARRHAALPRGERRAARARLLGRGDPPSHRARRHRTAARHADRPRTAESEVDALLEALQVALRCCGSRRVSMALYVEADAARAPCPLVCLHGWGMNLRVFDPLREAVSR